MTETARIRVLDHQKQTDRAILIASDCSGKSEHWIPKKLIKNVRRFPNRQDPKNWPFISFELPLWLIQAKGLSAKIVHTRK